jgi:hypothetical protein
MNEQMNEITGCMAVKSWSLTSRAESMLSMFENIMLRKIHLLGTKKGDVRGDWRKLYSEDPLLAKYY